MNQSNIFFFLEQEDLFSSIDIQFAIFINSFYKKNYFLILVSLYLSKHTRKGNIFLSLKELYAYILKHKNVSKIIKEIWNKFIKYNNILTVNIFSNLYILIFNKVIIPASKDIFAPIILQKNYLYLHKVWLYINRIKNFVINNNTSYNKASDKNFFFKNKNTFFLRSLYKLNKQQKRAILISLINRLTIIIGEAGTGKTSLILNIIQSVIKFFYKKNLLIYIVAPTGKATVKLIDLINTFKYRKKVNHNMINIENITTLHKRLHLLSSSEELINNTYNLLDLLIIDEASMVDIYLMDKVINNLLSYKTKLILIGDTYQLNAIGNIGVLSNIIKFTKEENNNNNLLFLKKSLQKISKKNKNKIIDKDISSLSKTSICSNIAVLTNIYRFSETSGIALLSKAIKQDNLILIKRLYFEQHLFKDIRWYSWEEKNIYKFLINNCVKDCKKILKKINCKEKNYKFNYISNYLNNFQILCLLNRGWLGTDRINEVIEGKLCVVPSGLYSNFWYNGKPIIILKNDYDLSLSNGEIGFSQFNTRLGIWEVKFFTNGLNYKTIKLKDIKHFKSAWAITIHKSQGSDFKKVILIIPPIWNINLYKKKHNNYISLINKELIYTAITRAKSKITIYASLDSFLFGINQQINNKNM